MDQNLTKSKLEMILYWTGIDVNKILLKKID